MIRFALLILFVSLSAGAQSALVADDAPTVGGLKIPQLIGQLRPNSDSRFYVAVYQRSVIDWSAPTHVIVTGHGNEAGTLFQNSAASRAKRYAEVFPSHQILLITVNELDGEENVSRLVSFGFTVVARRRYMLSVDYLLQELRDLQHIASMDIYAHSNDSEGAALDTDFLGPRSTQVEELRGKFMPQAWASVHGCNSGWYLAPALAAFWGVPVSGSFTGTHFQRLHSTSEFYPYDKSLAPAGPWAEVNSISYQAPQKCARSGCVRMHPDPYAYWGEWGTYKFGLGFYKYFCGPVAAADCETRMAMSLLGYVGKVDLSLQSSEAEFLMVVKEFMCPINILSPVRANCEQGIDSALASGDETYTPFLSNSLVCDETSCNEPDDGLVSTEFMKAVRAFLRGHKNLGRL